MKTIRRRIIDYLMDFEATARDISQALGIMEKEFYSHLPHIERSLSSTGRKLVVSPPKCLDCGYVFKERKRFTPPGRCPKCKGSHLGRAFFTIK